MPESAATPERDYALHSRRAFLKTADLGVADVALGSPGPLAGRILAATSGFPPVGNSDYRDPALKPTPDDLITSYNNFFEFGTDKSAPKLNAQKWKTEPWTVTISGLVRNPLKIEINDLIARMGGLEQRVYRMRWVEAWSMVIPWDGFSLAKLVALADP